MLSRSPKRDEAWRLFESGKTVDEVMEIMGSSRTLTLQRRHERLLQLEIGGSDSIDKNGHPVHGPDDDENLDIHSTPDQRDVIALEAMKGILPIALNDAATADHIAKLAYQIADAMIREKCRGRV